MVVDGASGAGQVASPFLAKKMLGQLKGIG